MLGQLRLADRRGLLEGRNLSRVQEFGLEIIVATDAIRSAMSNPQPMMMPMRPGEGDEVVVEEVTEANVYDDGEDIVWKMPEAGRDEMADFLASMGQVGSMTAADPLLDKE